jgi:YidC/Oxa1 family membrane protein insertase
VSTGLPWWATIVVTTLAARSLMLPLAFYQQKIAAHLQAATPELRAVEEEYQLAKTVYKDPGAEKRRKTKLEAIYATHHNCRPWKLFAYMGAQGPLFLTFFFGIKALARMYPDVTDGGLLWARNLAVPDPMHLLPIAAAATMLTTLEVNLRARQHLMQPMQYKMQLGVQRIVCLSAVPLLVGLKYPAGVFIYWVVNNLFSSVQVS